MKKYVFILILSFGYLSAFAPKNYTKHNVYILDGKTGETKTLTGYLEKYREGYKLTFHLKTGKKNNTSDVVYLYLFQQNYSNYVSVYVNKKQKKWEHLKDGWIIVTNYRNMWIKYDNMVGKIAFPDF